MAKRANLTIRLDADLKADAEKVLKELGMPMSTLITLLLKQVVMTQSIPFTMQLPQAPDSVDVASLSPSQFKAMLVEAWQVADRGETIPFDEFFQSFNRKS